MGVIVARPRGTGQSIVKEAAIGAIDGYNDEFDTSSKFFPGSLSVFYRGLRENNITPLGDTRFKMPLAPRINSSLIVEYIKW